MRAWWSSCGRACILRSSRHSAMHDDALRGRSRAGWVRPRPHARAREDERRGEEGSSRESKNGQGRMRHCVYTAMPACRYAACLVVQHTHMAAQQPTNNTHRQPQRRALPPRLHRWAPPINGPRACMHACRRAHARTHTQARAPAVLLLMRVRAVGAHDPLARVGLGGVVKVQPPGALQLRLGELQSACIVGVARRRLPASS